MEHSTQKIQVVLAARHFLYRLGLKTIISVIGFEPEIVEVNSYTELCKQLDGVNSPDFLIVNQDIIPDTVDTFLKKVNAHSSNCKLMIAVNSDSETEGNTRFFANLENQKEVVEKFQDFFFEPVDNKEDCSKSNLSEREVDVLKNVALGLANKEIAERLFISTNTVITHRKNITEKLGIKTIAGLTVYALMNSLIQPEEVKN